MRTQLMSILAMGIMTLIAFGMMAGYLTGLDPRTKVLRKIEQDVQVKALALEERSNGRELYLHLKPLPGVAPTRNLAWQAIRVAQPALQAHRAGKAPFAVWSVEVDGAGVLRVSDRTVQRHRILAQLTQVAASGISAATGPGAQISVVERGKRLGVRVRARIGKRSPRELGRLVMRLTGNQPDFVSVVAADADPETTMDVTRPGRR